MLICSLLSLISFVFLFYALKEIKDRPKVKKAEAKYLNQILNGYKFIKTNYFLSHYFWSSILYSFVTPAMAILLPRIAQKNGQAGLYTVCFTSVS